MVGVGIAAAAAAGQGGMDAMVVVAGGEVGTAFACADVGAASLFLGSSCLRWARRACPASTCETVSTARSVRQTNGEIVMTETARIAARLRDLITATGDIVAWRESETMRDEILLLT